MAENWAAEVLTANGEFSYHAFWLRGGLALARSKLRDFLITRAKVAPADLAIIVANTLTIEDSRHLKSLTGAAVLGPTRVLAIAFQAINREAEQALLKLLEEPPAGTIIILLTPVSVQLLPTIVSRVRIVEIRSREETMILSNNEPQELERDLQEREETLVVKMATLGRDKVESARQALANIRRWQSLLPHSSPKLLREYLALIWPKL